MLMFTKRNTPPRNH